MNHESHSKTRQPSRKRVSQACHRCRGRRDRCDGVKPNCSACRARGAVCSYDIDPRKRGLPEGYVRDLEAYTKGLVDYARELEVGMGRLLQIQKDTQTVIFPDEGSFWEASGDETARDNLYQRWCESRLCRELKRRHPVMKTAEDKVKRHKGSVGGSMDISIAVSEADTASNVSQQVREGQLISNDRDPQSPSTNLQPEVPASEISQALASHSCMRSDSISLPRLPSRSWRLLNIYFAHTHSWLPIVEKNDILKTFHQGHGTIHKAKVDANLGSEAVLWSILAFADIQHQSIEPSSLDGQEEVPLTTEQLYFYARSQIPAEDGIFDIGHVQALLILSLVSLGLNRCQAAWLLVGQAVRIAVQLGLNRCSPSSLQPRKPTTSSQDDRTLLGCFALDTLIAARLGRCPHLGIEDVDSIGWSVDENGLEEWDPWLDCLGKSKRGESVSRQPPLIFSTFNQFIFILGIVNETIRQPPARTGQDMKLVELGNKLRQTMVKPNDIPQLSLTSPTSSDLLPHHLNYHLTCLSSFATLAIKQCCINGAHNDDQEHIHELRDILERMTIVLEIFSRKYRLDTAPPIFEYFMFVLLELGRTHDSHKTSSTVPKVMWKLRVFSQLEGISKVWPSFGMIHQALKKDGSEDDSFEMLPLCDKSTYRNFEYGMTQTSMPSFTTPSRSNDCNGARGIVEPSSIIMEPNDSLDSTTQVDLLIQRKDEMAAIITLPNPPPIQTNLSQSPPRRNFDFPPDHDTLFHEFSTVDTTEWAGTQDQCLQNLGFTATEMTNLDFYDFCQDFKTP